MRWISLAVLLALLGLTGTAYAAKAARGTPSSPEFGYGARLDQDGQLVSQALASAADLKLDWIELDFDWARQWPDATHQPDLHTLDQAMQVAAEYKLPVAISISDAPGWARTDQGPDPVMTAWFVANLARRYPNTLQAVELFPGANTRQGWGARPDPQLYSALLNAAQAGLQKAGLPLLLVAGGLTPLPPAPSGQDLDDLGFLQSLYAAGGLKDIPIVSIRYADIIGDPLKAPDGSEHRILRHYEEVRQVMLANDDKTGILWITDLSWPSGKIQESDSIYQNPEVQAVWLRNAYRQLRAQLYIGAAFLHRLNPSSTGGGESASSLIRSNNSLHPFYEVLGKLILQNNPSAPAPPTFGQSQQKDFYKSR